MAIIQRFPRFFDDFMASYNDILIQKILFRCWEVGV